MSVLIPLLLATPAVAFGTITSGGQHAEHEHITRIALACPENTPSNGSCFEPLSITSFAGGEGTFGAIGAPDGGTDVFESKAHCDDADYLDHAKWGINGTYPRTKENRTQTFADCYGYLKDKWYKGIASAAELVGPDGKLKLDEVSLADNDGKGTACTFTGGFSNRAKCDVYDGLGRALHGLEDFYAHSNWVDDESTQGAPGVPPGLGNREIAPFLSMVNGNGPNASNVPDDLSSGCFNLFGTDTVNGAAACLSDGRTITHVVLNKDKGIVNVLPQAAVPGTSLTSGPTTPRGQISDNFERAVEGAVLEARRQWADFRATLKEKYNSTADVMICALTHDYPLRDCYPGRTVALVVHPDSVDVAKNITSALVSQSKPGDKPADKLGVFDSQQVSAIADPTAATFNVSSTVLGQGVRAATTALNSTTNQGILIVSPSSGDNVTDLVAAINAAGAKGIRVSHALVAQQQGVARRAFRFIVRLLRRHDTTSVNTDVATAILKTGGSYTVISNTGTNYAAHILNWGLSNGDPSGQDMYEHMTAVANTERTFTYKLVDDAKVNTTVTTFGGNQSTVTLSQGDKQGGSGAGSMVSLETTAKDGDDVKVHVVPSGGLYAVSLEAATSGARRLALPSLALLVPVIVAFI